MGLRFRKSVNFGPFRVNLSKSGIGYSVGGKGARITKKAKGGFRATASVPGTGVSYTTDFGGKKSNSQRNSGKKQAVVPDTPNQPNSPKKKFSLGEALIALVLVLILVAASSCSDDSDNPTAQAEQPTTTIEQTEEQPKAEPENPDSYTLDYPDAESFESALNNGEKVNGKTVIISQILKWVLIAGQANTLILFLKPDLMFPRAISLTLKSLKNRLKRSALGLFRIRF